MTISEVVTFILLITEVLSVCGEKPLLSGEAEPFCPFLCHGHFSLRERALPRHCETLPLTEGITFQSRLIQALQKVGSIWSITHILTTASISLI